MSARHGLLNEVSKNRTLFIMLLPAVIYFVAFAYLPMVGTIIAFKDYKFNLGMFMSPWAGLKNFEFLFNSGKVWLLTKNTILYNLSFIIVSTFFQVTTAILLSEIIGKYFKKFVQSLTFLPYFASWVVVGSIAYNVLNYEYGSLNNILKFLNLQPVDVYGSPEAWKYILVAFHSWKWVGYGSVIYLAAITGIDVSMYESGKVDGINIFQKIRYITIPMITPTIVILVLLAIGNIMRGNFDLFFQLVGYNGVLYDATDVIDTYVFRSLTKSLDISLPAAAGLYQSVLGFAIIMITNAVVKRISEDNALF